MDKLEDLKAAMEHSYRCAPDGTKVYKAEPTSAYVAALESRLSECQERERKLREACEAALELVGNFGARDSMHPLTAKLSAALQP